MPKGKYTAADVAPDNGSMPNAGPMGKYSAEDVADAPVTDDSSISRFFTGAADRVKGLAEGMVPQGADEVIGGPGYKIIKGAVQGAKGAYDSAKRSAEEGDIPGSMLKSVATAIPLVGPGAASIYDRAKSGDTAGAAGMGSVDALAMLLPTKGGKVADMVADSAAHPMIKGAGRVVRDFDITKPFKSIGENVAGPAMDKLGQMRAARGRPTLQSPLDPNAGVKVAPIGVGSDTPPPRIPSPAEDLVSALEEGKGEVAPRSMQPTGNMTSGEGGANYSADDLANLISKHNIPPAPGEIVGGTPRPTGIGESLDDAGILQAMREDLDAHGRNALHEESTDFAARNKVSKPKVGKPGYGWKRKLPEAGQ